MAVYAPVCPVHLKIKSTVCGKLNFVSDHPTITVIIISITGVEWCPSSDTNASIKFELKQTIDQLRKYTPPARFTNPVVYICFRRNPNGDGIQPTKVNNNKGRLLDNQNPDAPHKWIVAKHKGVVETEKEGREHERGSTAGYLASIIVEYVHVQWKSRK